MKRPLLAAVALLCAIGLSSITQAQTTTVTASSISLGGVAISAGTVTLTPADNNGNAIPFVTGGGGLNGPTAFTGNIVSGAISGSFVVPDACLATPVNLIYKALIKNTSTGVSFGYNIVGLCGTSWALDQYAPPSVIVNVQSIIGYSGTSVPGSCVAPAFFTKTDTGKLYSCIAGAYVLVGGGVTPTGENTVTFSSTPTFSTSYLANTITLTGAVSSSTLAAGSAGQHITLNICQDATGSRSFVWPTTVPGGPTIGTTASKCNSYVLTYSTAKTEWLVGGITNQ